MEKKIINLISKLFFILPICIDFFPSNLVISFIYNNEIPNLLIKENLLYLLVYVCGA